MPDSSVFRIFSQTARQYPDRICLITGANRITYREVERRAHAVAAFLQRELSVKPGEAVAVFADYCPDWLAVSLAIQAIGAVEFPRSESQTGKDLGELVRRTRCRIFFYANEQVRSRLAGGLKRKEGSHAILCASDFLNKLPRGTHALAEIFQRRDMHFREYTFPVSAVILTSGTTGPAKWVPVMQRSFLHSMRVIPRLLSIGTRDIFLSCLPSWHLYARLVEFVALSSGAAIVYSDIHKLAATLKNSGCTIFPSFPEIWEQIHHGIIAELESRPGAAFWRRSIQLVTVADRVYERWFGRVRHESKVVALSDFLKLGYLLPLRWLLQRFVFRRIRQAVAPALRYAIMGDAPLPLSVDETLRALGFQVLEGYGSTEQCVTALRRPARNFPGAVGRALPGVHVRIAADKAASWNGLPVGEILVQGENVFNGYFDTIQSLGGTAQDEMDYATGDVGTIDREGNLIVIGRMANAFRLLSGETVYPELIENVLRGSRYVGRVFIFGKNCAQTVALVVPDFPQLLQRAIASGYAQLNPSAAAKPEAHQKFWRQLVRHHGQTLYETEFFRLLSESGLPQYARPAACLVLPHPFHRGQELTATLKPRREVILKKYAAELSRLLNI